MSLWIIPAFLTYVSFSGAMISSPFWVPRAWSRFSGLWQQKSDCGRLAMIVIEMLDQPGWRWDKSTMGWMHHQTGLSLSLYHDRAEAYMGFATPEQQQIKLTAYWKRRVWKRVKEWMVEQEAQARAKAERQLGENIIQFAEKVKALR